MGGFRSRIVHNARLDQIIGNTPLIKLDIEQINLYTKLEFYNFMGSVKDRAAYSVINAALERGEISRNSTVIESSSGNFAVALAGICNSLGIKFIAVIDPNINPTYEKILKFFSYQTLKVEERDEKGGYLLSRLRAVADLCKQIPDSYWTRQYSNLDIFRCHYEGVGREISESFDKLDYVFVAVSTGGTIAGISRRLKEKFRNIKVIAVDVEGSIIFGGTPKKRYISGMGSVIVPDLIKEAIIDEVVHVAECDSIQGCHELFRSQGIFAGGSSGTVYHAIVKYFNNIKMAEKPNVVFICPDRGTAYVDNIYDSEWIRWFKNQTVGRYTNR